MAKTSVIITFRLEGLHCWPEAKDVFPDVSFLSNTHRHMFQFKLATYVNHGDRDIEFISWKREVEDWMFEKYGSEEFKCHNFGRMSCEQIAQKLLEEFNCVWVEVWEDGENGARVEI